MKEKVTQAKRFFNEVIDTVAYDSLGGSTDQAKGTEMKHPKTQMTVVLLNYAGMLYILLDSFVLFVITICLTVPHAYYSYETPENMLWANLFACFAYVNFMANYVLIMFGFMKSVYCTPKELPLYNVQSHEDWTMCSRCDRKVPPRAHHCNICDRCILKRDHHCFFTGCCIGFYNQRYFICLALWGCVASLFSLYYLHIYLSQNFVSFFSTEFYKYFLPFAFATFIFGYVDFSILLLLVLFYLTLVGALAGGYFCAWQLNLLWTGQTSWEYLRGKKTYWSSFQDNAKSIFGKYWYLNFIFPLPFIKNEGDGLTWETVSTKFL